MEEGQWLSTQLQKVAVLKSEWVQSQKKAIVLTEAGGASGEEEAIEDLGQVVLVLRERSVGVGLKRGGSALEALVDDSELIDHPGLARMRLAGRIFSIRSTSAAMLRKREVR